MQTISWRSSAHTKSFEIGLLIICAVAIFLVEQVRWDRAMRSQVEWLTVPISSQAAKGIEVLIYPALAINTYFSSALEMNHLREQHAQALADLAQLEQLRQENQVLRAMLENNNPLVQEQVIAVPVVSYAYPAIAVGSEQGVVSGQIVVINDTVVGRVSEVGKQQSKVQLLSSPDSQPLLVETESGVQGLARGTGKGVVLTQVLPDQTLVIGERVITAGQPGVQTGLLVGVIIMIEPISTAPTQTAGVDQLVSFYTTPLVEVR